MFSFFKKKKPIKKKKKRVVKRKRRFPKSNYERSNAVLSVDIRISSRMKLLTQKILQSNTTVRRQKLSSLLVQELCTGTNIGPVKVKISDKKQYHKKSKGRVVYRQYGYYKSDTKYIYINNRTAVQQKILAQKTFLDTLLHEWLHHYDSEYLKLDSIHTTGFYTRLKDLKGKLGM